MREHCFTAQFFIRLRNTYLNPSYSQRASLLPRKNIKHKIPLCHPTNSTKRKKNIRYSAWSQVPTALGKTDTQPRPLLLNATRRKQRALRRSLLHPPPPAVLRDDPQYPALSHLEGSSVNLSSPETAVSRRSGAVSYWQCVPRAQNMCVIELNMCVIELNNVCN